MRLLPSAAARGLILLTAVLAAGPVSAAYRTSVLTAAERGNPIDLDLGVSFDAGFKQGRVTREWIQPDGGMLKALDVKELEVKEVTQRLLIELRVGLFHDLEFHLTAPIVLSMESDIGFLEGVDAGRSTITPGSPNADDAGYLAAPRFPITDVPARRVRNGFGDMTFGLAWSPLVDHKDEAYPTLTLRGDVIAPTGPTRDPTDLEAIPPGSGGGVGLGQTTFDLSLGVSRRMGLFDPYMIFGAQIPVATPKQSANGLEPPATGRFTVGTELHVYEDPDRFQYYSIDLSFETRYIGVGRTYSELSDYLPNFDQTKPLAARGPVMGSPDAIVYDDFRNAANYGTKTVEGAKCGNIMGIPCGELNRVDEHLALRGTLALHFRVAEFFFIRGGAALEHVTDHLLTTERVGRDLDPPNAPEICDGAPCSGRVNARNASFDRTRNICPEGKTCDERSKYYDPRYDAPGRRFRLEDSMNVVLFLSSAATF